MRELNVCAAYFDSSRPEPPTVSLSEEKVVFQDEPAQKISCHCRSYYPLDVQVCTSQQQVSQLLTRSFMYQELCISNCGLHNAQ